MLYSNQNSVVAGIVSGDIQANSLCSTDTILSMYAPFYHKPNKWLKQVNTGLTKSDLSCLANQYSHVVVREAAQHVAEWIYRDRPRCFFRGHGGLPENFLAGIWRCYEPVYTYRYGLLNPPLTALHIEPDLVNIQTCSPLCWAGGGVIPPGYLIYTVDVAGTPVALFNYHINLINRARITVGVLSKLNAYTKYVHLGVMFSFTSRMGKSISTRKFPTKFVEDFNNYIINLPQEAH